MQDNEESIQWSGQRIAAVCVAGLSMLITIMVTFDAETICAQACLLLFLLAVIFWPEVMDNHFRRTQGGVFPDAEIHPGFLVQLVAWIALLFFVGWPLIMMIWFPDVYT